MKLNIIFVLLMRELLKINKNLFFYTLYMTLFPLFLYTIISLPLSTLILDIKPVYNNWSAAGIWIVTALFSCYTFSFNLFKSCFSMESFFSLPISPFNFLIFSYIYSLIIAFIQLFISILFITTLNSDSVSLANYLLLSFLFFPVIIIISNISFILSQFNINETFLLVINLFFFLFICFALGAFIPLKYFPDSYSRFIDFFPIAGLINNSQRIIGGDDVSFSLFLISFFISLILSFLVFLKIEKKITKK